MTFIQYAIWDLFTTTGKTFNLIAVANVGYVQYHPRNVVLFILLSLMALTYIKRTAG